MRLVYIWIESYKWIHKKGYMLSSAFRVENDGDTLHFYKNSGLDPMIYGKNISVTAVVGDNGAGKSTLLDVIRAMLFDKAASETIKGFLVFEERGALYVMSSGLYDIPFRIISREPGGEDNLISQNEERLVREPFGKFGLVYYSDVLDLKYYDEGFDDERSSQRKGDYFQRNISTSGLLKESGDSVRDYFHRDIEKQFLFYGEMREQEADLLPFPLPETLYVTIENNDLDGFEKVFPDIMDTYAGGLLQNMENYFGRRQKSLVYELDGYEVLQCSLLTTYLYNTLLDSSYRRNSIEVYDELEDELKRTVPFEKYKDFGECISELFSAEGNKYEFTPYVEFYNKFRKLSEEDSKADLHIVLRSEDGKYSVMKGTGKRPEWHIKTSKEQFFEVFRDYKVLTANIDFLHFSWGMSSGETAFFNLFSRLDDALRNSGETDSMILIFDELDSSFHPEWQQRIISELTGFLRKRYRKVRFQVIITTHSPVVLSDIPRENVIFMNREGSEEKVHEQTFAANISSLYYDSFFMHRGSIGETAGRSLLNLLNAIDDTKKEYAQKTSRQKIAEMPEQALLERFLKLQGFEDDNSFICGASTDEDAGRVIRKLADSIGEPIWKYKVNERLNDLMRSCGGGQENLYMEIEKMRSQMGDERFYELLMHMQEVEN